MPLRGVIIFTRSVVSVDVDSAISLFAVYLHALPFVLLLLHSGCVPSAFPKQHDNSIWSELFKVYSFIVIVNSLL